MQSLDNLALKHTAMNTMSEETALIEVPPACPLCQAVSICATCSFIWRSPEAVSGVWRIKTQWWGFNDIQLRAIDSQSQWAALSVYLSDTRQLSRAFVRWKHQRSIGHRGESITRPAPCGFPGEAPLSQHTFPSFLLRFQCTINRAHKTCIRLRHRHRMLMTDC